METKTDKAKTRKLKHVNTLDVIKKYTLQKQNSVESTKDFIENTGIKLEGRC